jgi:ABC-2 type transport system ATP-binding protein
MGRNMTIVLEVRALSKKYAQLVAVNQISFQVAAGRCFGLLGPNGAGKTTTIEMLEGLIAPDSGEILYHGRPAKKEDFQQLGVQFQQTALQDYLTVQETLQLFAAFYDHPADLNELIQLCELTDFLHQDHRKLSGGQKQRLLLALALVNQPKILFLDEPTTGLDPHARRNFWQLIKQIKAQGRTVILTTHYMDEAEQLCDEILIMDKGQIIAHDTPERLLAAHFNGALLRLPDQGKEPKLAEGVSWHRAGGYLHINSTEIEQTITALLAQNFSLEGLYIKSANLDDLFLKLTGHRLSA